MGVRIGFSEADVTLPVVLILQLYSEKGKKGEFR